MVRHGVVWLWLSVGAFPPAFSELKIDFDGKLSLPRGKVVR